MNKICGIYKIVCNENHKIYVGSSSDIKSRWNRHKHNMKNNRGNPNMLNSYKKYGNTSFSFEVIEECDVKMLIEREIYWANFYKSQGYVLFNCGDFIESPTRRLKPSLEIRQKISKSLLGNTRTKGKKVTEETKNKISNSLKLLGRKMSQSNLEKLRVANKKPKSEEHKLNISKSRTESYGIKLICLDTNEIFNSYKEAADKFNVPYQGIRQAILRNGKCSGLKFKKLTN